MFFGALGFSFNYLDDKFHCHKKKDDRDGIASDYAFFQKLPRCCVSLGGEIDVDSAYR